MKISMIDDVPVSPSPFTDEVEATEFLGHELTPISQQNNAAVKGTQYIDRATFRLTVDGLVEHPLSLSYADLQAFLQISRLMNLDCVEGWNFTAKWTGPTLKAIFDKAKVKPKARVILLTLRCFVFDNRYIFSYFTPQLSSPF